MLDDLIERKQLSDERYADMRAHVLGRRFGAARVQHELRAKGVSDDTVERVLGAAEASELERAREVWRKRFGVPPANASERAKQMRFLQSRGFSFDIIRQVVTKE